MKKWSITNLSKYRSEILGFATILVMIFHSFRLNFINLFGQSKLTSILNFIRKTGNIGVDIFLILSGIGLYYSFNKNNNIKEFYKKRILRIIPPSIIIAVLYFLFKKTALKDFILGITFTAFYINGNRYFWYISFIIVMYLIYPLLHKIISKYDYKSLMLIIFTIIINYIIMKTFPTVYKNIEIALTRIPVFIFGIYLGKKNVDETKINKIYIILSGIIFIITNYLLYNISFPNYVYVRYLYGLLAITIVILLSYLLSIIKTNKINKLLIFIGTYSLEVYLIYEKLGIELYYGPLGKLNVILFYTLNSIFTLVISYILKKLLGIFKSNKK